jgi:hypothetical protein
MDVDPETLNLVVDPDPCFLLIRIKAVAESGSNPDPDQGFFFIQEFIFFSANTAIPIQYIFGMSSKIPTCQQRSSGSIRRLQPVKELHRHEYFFLVLGTILACLDPDPIHCES